MMQRRTLPALSVGGILRFQAILTTEREEAAMRRPKHQVTCEEDLFKVSHEIAPPSFYVRNPPFMDMQGYVYHVYIVYSIYSLPEIFSFFLVSFMAFLLK